MTDPGPLGGIPPAPPGAVQGRQRFALGTLLVVSFAAAAWIASPLRVGIMFGVVMAFTVQPLYRKVLALRTDPRLVTSRRRSYIAASFVTLASALVAAVVGVASLYVLTRELLVIGRLLQERLAIGTPLDALGPRALHLLDEIHVNRTQVAQRLNELLAQAQGKAVAATGVILQATTGGVLGLLIALVTEFYVLVEWPALALRLESVLPLDPRHTRALMLEFRDVSRSALVGTVATAFIQGLVAGTGYAIAGVATPVTWGLITAISSLLPAVGTFLVWVPVAGYELWNGHIGRGVFILIWGFVLVSFVTDYVIRPRLVGRSGRGHPLLMLVSLLGGIEVMGLAGLIVAPIVMSLFLAVLKIYEGGPMQSSGVLGVARADGSDP
jgi:predicted PurR-regulated permease PerM